MFRSVLTAVTKPSMAYNNGEFTILAAKQWYENIQVPEITNNFAGGEEGEKIYPYWDMAIVNT